MYAINKTVPFVNGVICGQAVDHCAPHWGVFRILVPDLVENITRGLPQHITCTRLFCTKAFSGTPRADNGSFATFSFEAFPAMCNEMKNFVSLPPIKVALQDYPVRTY